MNFNIIRIATENDLEFIYKLWCKNSKTLGICWRGMILNDINKENIYIINNIGFVRINEMKRKPVVKINGICIVKEERNKGYGKLFINYIIDKFDKPIILEAVKDAENNLFYNKIGEIYGEKQSKKVNLYKYVINKENHYFDNKW